MAEFTAEMSQFKYPKDLNPGDAVTVRVSDAVTISDCILLSKSFMVGKVLYTVAVPTGEKVEDKGEFGCLVNANVFIGPDVYVRWENLDSTMVNASDKAS